MKLFKNLSIDKLKTGLLKTRSSILNSLSEVLSGKAVIDESVLEKLEEILLGADLGAKTTEKVVENLKVKLKDSKDRSREYILQSLKYELVSILESNSQDNEWNSSNTQPPYVILIVGVNGVGKTTTVGKLAHNYKIAGNKVIIGSADTFRAAAKEQLNIWTERAQVEVVQKDHGSDP
jgi:fused signal recognition particle receptor